MNTRLSFPNEYIYRVRFQNIKKLFDYDNIDVHCDKSSKIKKYLLLTYAAMKTISFKLARKMIPNWDYGLFGYESTYIDFDGTHSFLLSREYISFLCWSHCNCLIRSVY